MRILSLLILFLPLLLNKQQIRSPHGSDFKVGCSLCHSPESWKFDKSVYNFDHGKTAFALTGQHRSVKCRQCHSSLIFSEARTECNDCHDDVHQASTGSDCGRCHKTDSWLVKDVTGIHQSGRFPLLGAHRLADCHDCHRSETLIRFDVPGINCIDCHKSDYLSADNPDHVGSGMSQDCSLCHNINAFAWSGGSFDHSSFPLAQGHGSVRCNECHTTDNYVDADPDCYNCHESDFLAARSPDHSGSQFSTDCGNCHTLIPGWKPASFNHSFFPLTLGHALPGCIDCHKGGNYTNISNDCYTCHQQNYVSTTNPDHVAAGFPNVCLTCHTTNPGWKPAAFDHSGFPLTLGHSSVQCSECHSGGNYSSVSSDCYSCHATDYNNASVPDHKTLEFSTSCLTCHTVNPGWQPARFAQHDSQYFPVYSGRHNGVWDLCSDCHTNQSDYGVFNCIVCHSGVHSGHNYTSTQCYSCHPTGRED